MRYGALAGCVQNHLRMGCSASRLAQHGRCAHCVSLGHEPVFHERSTILCVATHHDAGKWSEGHLALVDEPRVEPGVTFAAARRADLPADVIFEVSELRPEMFNEIWKMGYGCRLMAASINVRIGADVIGQQRQPASHH